MKTIPGYSRYSVTRDGRVKIEHYDKRWMTPVSDRNGYQRIYMVGDTGVRRGVYLHQIVAQTYLPNPENKPQVNHLDNNPANNKVSNLEWCTAKENRAYAAKQNRLPKLQGEDNGHAKYTAGLIGAVRNRYKEGLAQVEISKMYNIPQPTVSVIVRKIQWRHI